MRTHGMADAGRKEIAWKPTPNEAFFVFEMAWKP